MLKSCSRFKCKGRNNSSKKLPVYLTEMFYNSVKFWGGVDIIEAVLYYASMLMN